MDWGLEPIQAGNSRDCNNATRRVYRAENMSPFFHPGHPGRTEPAVHLACHLDFFLARVADDQHYSQKLPGREFVRPGDPVDQVLVLVEILDRLFPR